MNFQSVEFEAASGRADQLKKSDLPEIVFSGKSNVGKSSLINKLVNRKALALSLIHISAICRRNTSAFSKRSSAILLLVEIIQFVAVNAHDKA